MAWAVLDGAVHVVLCLEDGSSVTAGPGEYKFDYRYDLAHDRWVDVSRIQGEGSDGNADPEDAHDGSPQVQG